MFCHEGAVDLDDVDAELAQVAERGVAGAEIVDGDAAAEILDAGDEAAGLVDVLDRRALGDLDDQPLARRRDACAAASSSPAHQSGSVVEAGETLRLACKRRRGDHLVDHEFEHAVVEQAHQAEPFGDRNDLAGAQQSCRRCGGCASGIRRRPAAGRPPPTTVS